MSQIRLLMIDELTYTTSIDRAGYREKGIFVQTAHDYSTAIDALKKKSIDVISFNLDSTKENAYTIIRGLKAYSSEKNIPLIVTSIQNNKRTQKQALDSGADIFVEQPIPRDFFIEKIKATLDQSTRDNLRISAIGHLEIKSKDGSIVKLDIEDLSSTGVLSSYSDLVKEDQEVEIKLILDGLSTNISTQGTVVRLINSDARRGVGIRFNCFKGSDQKKLTDYIIKHQIESYQLKYYL